MLPLAPLLHSPFADATVQACERLTRMTHQPPVPEAGTSPYPLHPEPIYEENTLAAAAADAKSRAVSQNAKRRREAGAVTAIAFSTVAAAAIGLLMFRRSMAQSPLAKVKAAKRTRAGDNKRKPGKADRARVAASEPYEVTYFARKHRITAAEARAIIKEAGPNRAAANALAARRTKA